MPYDKAAPGRHAMFANNQVFDQAAFPALLQGLWEASGRESHAFPAVFSQRLGHCPTSGSASRPRAR